MPDTRFRFHRLCALMSITVGAVCAVCVVVLPSTSARAGVRSAVRAGSSAASQPPRPITNLAPAQSLVRTMDVTFADPRYEERGRAALALMRFNYAELFPNWTVAFLPAKDQLLGLTLVRERRIEIYVRKGRSVEGLAHDLGHEFGHVLDVTYNDEPSRQKYLELRNLSTATPWWACNSCRDLEVGAGDFAEVFAQMVTPRFAFYSKVKGAADQATLQAIREQLMPKEFQALT